MNHEHLTGLDSHVVLKLLEHDNLAVKSEDQALEIACAWVASRKLDNISDFMDNIRWDYVSTPGLLNVISSYPDIKSHSCFAGIFTDLIKRRSSGIRESRHPPRSEYTFTNVPSFNI